LTAQRIKITRQHPILPKINHIYRTKPVFEDLGENIFYLGDTGTGHAIKLINNFFGMTLASAMSEAFAMGDKAGVDRQQLYDVISAGPLKSMMMDLVKAYAVDGDLNKLEFSIKNANKDVGYVLSMAKEMNFQTFIAPATSKLLNEATQSGYGDKNVPAILDYISEINKE
jgi:3-hydroxyisobutyrate dehydrogenase-like beta-hydroxyacid dehydrogenase